MQLRDMLFTGYFEENENSSSETLQVVVPDGDLERDLLAWAILSEPQTVSEDPARVGYTFHYELGEEIDRGVFKMVVSCTDQSGVDHSAEIAAALISTPPTEAQRVHVFEPTWLLSESVHFKPRRNMSRDQYHGAAYGHLLFGETAILPHRRLFGAAV